MFGIDYEKASIDIRGHFSFIQAEKEKAYTELKSQKVNAVILSTCNRAEFYWDNDEFDMFDYVCRFKGLDAKAYEDSIKRRNDEDLLRHLFFLGAGLRSQIVGEDQILTQLKTAITESKQFECSDKVLEMLFKKAIESGKKVRSEITFTHGNTSASSAAIDRLKMDGYDFSGKKCIVIGNGEMGKLTAELLKAEGADVTVTVRQYRSGMVCIPTGCERIDYGRRYELMPDCDFIFSATASPNLTILKENVEGFIGKGKGKVFVDLAVPRDIDAGIKDLNGAHLYDIDSFNLNTKSAEQLKEEEQASKIIYEKIDEFKTWEESLDLIPRIISISKNYAADCAWRTRRVYKELSLSKDQQELLEEEIMSASEKVVSKLLYALRDDLSSDELRKCLLSIEGD